MSNTTIERSLGAPWKSLRGKWGWFVALGGGLLAAGVIAGLNLLLATIASVVYIAAMMMVGGGMQIVHAFTTGGWDRRILYVLVGLLYTAAGAICVYDPLLTAVGISLLLGVLLIAAGTVRIVAGLQLFNYGGWGWIVGSGLYTIVVGMLIIVAWPIVGAWLLGAILTADLVFQGVGFIGFGLALRSRQHGHGGLPLST